MATECSDGDWTARTGVPVTVRGAFKVYVGEPPICFRMPKELARKSSLVARHLKAVERQPRVELSLRTACQYLGNILRSEPFTAERPSGTETVLRAQHAKHKIVWRFFKTVPLQIPTELENTRADIYPALLYRLGIDHYQPRLSRRDFANFFVRPKLAALEAGDDLSAFDDFIADACTEAFKQLHALEHQTSSDGLYLREQDPVMATVFFRALWSNKLRFLEDDGQVRSLTWRELIDLSDFATHMGAHGLLQPIRDEFPEALDAEPDTDLIRRHIVIHRVDDLVVFRMCERELTKRKMEHLSIKGPEDVSEGEDEDWEMIEHPQMD